MLVHLLYPKYLVLYSFIFSGVYVHYRGKVRHRFFRQLTDHSTLMAPINAFMYMFSKVPDQPYHNVDDFPELKVFKDNWQVIRDEAQALVDSGYIKASDGYNDVGFNSFFRRGWKRFYLKWYKDFHPSAKELCPETIKLLEQVRSVKAAMFTLLPKDSVLMKHRDPYAGSLRYHLGLITPNSEKCWINVDGEEYFWQDGQDVMFDETYIHHAKNDSDQDRLIFFCDIERPMKYKWARLVNSIFSSVIMRAAATKNVDSEKVGFINKIFKYIYAFRLANKRLKAYNETLYYCVKYVGFGLLFYLLFF